MASEANERWWAESARLKAKNQRRAKRRADTPVWLRKKNKAAAEQVAEQREEK